MDSIYKFQVTLIDNILVKILWHDYFSFVSSNKHESVCSGLSTVSPENKDLPVSKKTEEASRIKYPMSYLQDLRSCIIDVLSGIFFIEHSLLSSFCMEFHESCLGLFQPATISGTEVESVERATQFILFLGQHAMQKGETWPVVYLVGPMLAKSFPLIKSLVSSYSFVCNHLNRIFLSFCVVSVLSHL